MIWKYFLQDTYLVTFHEGCLFVIDPGLGNFCGYHTGMNTIKDVVVCEDEIFVLSSGPETELRRIAQKPLPGKFVIYFLTVYFVQYLILVLLLYRGNLHCNAEFFELLLFKVWSLW